MDVDNNGHAKHPLARSIYRSQALHCGRRQSTRNGKVIVLDCSDHHQAHVMPIVSPSRCRSYQKKKSLHHGHKHIHQLLTSTISMKTGKRSYHIDKCSCSHSIATQSRSSNPEPFLFLPSIAPDHSNTTPTQSQSPPPPPPRTKTTNMASTTPRLPCPVSPLSN